MSYRPAATPPAQGRVSLFCLVVAAPGSGARGPAARNFFCHDVCPRPFDWGDIPCCFCAAKRTRPPRPPRSTGTPSAVRHSTKPSIFWTAPAAISLGIHSPLPERVLDSRLLNVGCPTRCAAFLCNYSAICCGALLLSSSLCVAFRSGRPYLRVGPTSPNAGGPGDHPPKVVVPVRLKSGVH